MKNVNVKILCESCDHAIRCRTLDPYHCEKFLLAVSSNFNARIKISKVKEHQLLNLKLPQTTYA